jgi:hypothetical protein
MHLSINFNSDVTADISNRIRNFRVHTLHWKMLYRINIHQTWGKIFSVSLQLYIKIILFLWSKSDRLLTTKNEHQGDLDAQLTQKPHTFQKLLCFFKNTVYIFVAFVKHVLCSCKWHLKTDIFCASASNV